MAKAKAKKKPSFLDKVKKVAKQLQEVSKAFKNFSLEKFHGLMSYLRVNDENNKLSLTNLALMLMLYKVYMTPAVSITDLTALFVAIANYGHKRHVNKDT